MTAGMFLAARQSARHAKPADIPHCDYGCDNITAMATPEDWMIIRAALSPLCEPLYRCADRSHDMADNHFIQNDMDDAQHPGGRAHLARHHLRHHLRQEKNNLGDWKLSKPRPNGEVILSLGTMKLRMLRPGPNLYSKLPTPPTGRNRARISYYRNPHLNLFGAAGSNLIGVWAYDPDLEEVAIRIVRPVRTWRIGQYEKIDIDFFLPRDSKSLAAMEFVPNDEGMRLPLLEEGMEEGEEDADGSGG